MADLYTKLKNANLQLDKAQDVFEDVGDAMMERGLIDEPVKATAFADTIRNAKIGGSTDYNELDNKPTIGDTPIQGDIEPLLDDLYAKPTDIPTKVSDLENDAGYITSNDIPTKVSDLENDAGYLTEVPVQHEIVSEDGEKRITGAGEVLVKDDDEASGWAKEGDLLTTADSDDFVKYADEDHVIVDLPRLVRLKSPYSSASGEIQLSNSSFIRGNGMSLLDGDAYVNLGGNSHNAFLQMGPNMTIDAFTEQGRTRIWIDGQVVVGTPVGTQAGQTLRAVEVTNASAASLMDAAPKASSHIEWQAVDWPESKPYKIKNVEPTIELNVANVQLENFTVSVVDISDAWPLVVHLPAKPTDDTVRDCVLRLNCTVVPSQVMFVCDGEEVQFESDDEDWQELAVGANIISFSETQRG